MPATEVCFVLAGTPTAAAAHAMGSMLVYLASSHSKDTQKHAAELRFAVMHATTATVTTSRAMFFPVVDATAHSDVMRAVVDCLHRTGHPIQSALGVEEVDVRQEELRDTLLRGLVELDWTSSTSAELSRKHVVALCPGSTAVLLQLGILSSPQLSRQLASRHVKLFVVAPAPSSPQARTSAQIAHRVFHYVVTGSFLC